MKFIVSLFFLVSMIALVQGCGPIDNVDSDNNENGLNIVISPDSVVDVDPVDAKRIITSVIDITKYASVGLTAHPRTWYLSMHYTDTWGMEMAQLKVINGEVISVSYDEYLPASVQSDNFYASCPNQDLEVWWSSECNTITSTVKALNAIHPNAQKKGYESEKCIGTCETVNNLRNRLACPNFKVWGRIGHGYTAGLQLANHELLNDFSFGELSGVGVYANSCQAYNNPFKDKVYNAGAEWYVSGITNLWIGPSEANFTCVMVDRALDQQNVCDSVKYCVQQPASNGAGEHGCGGNNQVIPKPGSGPEPTPTPTPHPGPTPEPTPDPDDPNSCRGHCGRDAPGGCWCDDLCESYNDCCRDKKAMCDEPNPTPNPQPTPTPEPTPGPTPVPTPDPTPEPTPNPNPGQSCSNPNGGNYCGYMAPGGCWCTSWCELYNMCCPDKQQICG